MGWVQMSWTYEYVGMLCVQIGIQWSTWVISAVNRLREREREKKTSTKNVFEQIHFVKLEREENTTDDR